MNAPSVTALVPALQGYPSVAKLLDSLHGQTRPELLRILILCRQKQQWDGPGRNGETFLEVGDALLNEARAAGIRAAATPYVLLAEDHCFPQPDWAEHVSAAVRDGWDVIGSSMLPGRSRRGVSLATFLLAYGEWFEPGASAEAAHLPGCNVVWRTDLLLQAGSALAEELHIPCFLQRQQKARNARLWLQSSARMQHWDATSWRCNLRAVFAIGAGFGAHRARGWARWQKLLYAACFPAIAVLHWKRGLRQWWCRGRAHWPLAVPLLFAAPIALAWGVGEALGSVLGVRPFERMISEVEMNRWGRMAGADLP